MPIHVEGEKLRGRYWGYTIYLGQENRYYDISRGRYRPNTIRLNFITRDSIYAIARICYRPSVRPSVRLSVRHTGVS